MRLRAEGPRDKAGRLFRGGAPAAVEQALRRTEQGWSLMLRRRRPNACAWRILRATVDVACCVSSRPAPDLLRRGLRYLQTDKGAPYLTDGGISLWDTLTSDDIVIIPAFGATDEDKKRLVRKGIAVFPYDATCMLVEKVWKAARVSLSIRPGDAGQ